MLLQPSRRFSYACFQSLGGSEHAWTEAVRMTGTWENGADAADCGRNKRKQRVRWHSAASLSTYIHFGARTTSEEPSSGPKPQIIIWMKFLDTKGRSFLLISSRVRVDKARECMGKCERSLVTAWFTADWRENNRYSAAVTHNDDWNASPVEMHLEFCHFSR